MKSCPTCNRTFEDTFTFCLMDGSVLSAPYDPQVPRQLPEPRRTTSPRTEVIPRSEISEESTIPPTMASPPLSTIQAPPPSVPSMTPQKVGAKDFDRVVRVYDEKIRRRAATPYRIAFSISGILALLLVLAGAYVQDITPLFVAFLFGMVALGTWLAARRRSS